MRKVLRLNLEGADEAIEKARKGLTVSERTIDASAATKEWVWLDDNGNIVKTEPYIKEEEND